MNNEEQKNPSPLVITRKMILGLATLTLLGFSSIGFLIIHFTGDRSSIDILIGQKAFWLQGLVGIGAGLVISFIAHYIISRPWMVPVNEKYSSLIAPIKLRPWDVLYVSLCAGIGEEVLFRGAIQPLIGVIFTAVVFVALHGYLNPKDARISVYGGFMVLAMIGIGILCDTVGIISTMIAHTIIDIYLLTYLNKAGQE